MPGWSRPGHARARTAAEAALNVLTKKDMAELKAYAKAARARRAVPQGRDDGAEEVARPGTPRRKSSGTRSSCPRLVDFDKELARDDALLDKMKKYVNDPEYHARRRSAKCPGAAKGLCQWVHAMFIYGNVAKEVAPKRAKLKAAQEALKKKQAALKEAEQKLQVVLDKVQALKDKYEHSTSKKKALEDELADLEAKLQRAEKLVNGSPARRRVGTEHRSVRRADRGASRRRRDRGGVHVVRGAVPVGVPRRAGREDLAPAGGGSWAFPASPAFDFALFLADPSDVRDWNIDGFPADAFSTENGVVVTRGNRWPLLIDPQGQGNKWIKNMEKPHGLKVVTLNMPDMVRRMENAIQFGDPVLIQDVQEEIDPILEPVLSKSFIKKGNSVAIKLGDKEVDYSPDFKLYLTSKLNNPHYTPEVSTKVTIVNFAVKEQGLEAQLLERRRAARNAPTWTSRRTTW